MIFPFLASEEQEDQQGQYGILGILSPFCQEEQEDQQCQKISGTAVGQKSAKEGRNHPYRLLSPPPCRGRRCLGWLPRQGRWHGWRWGAVRLGLCSGLLHRLLPSGNRWQLGLPLWPSPSFPRTRDTPANLFFLCSPTASPALLFIVTVHPDPPLEPKSNPGFPKASLARPDNLAS